MLKLQTAINVNDAVSNVFVSNHSEPLNVMAVGTWGTSATLTFEVNPDPKRQATWTTLSVAGNNVTMTSSDMLKTLQFPGGVHVRLKLTFSGATSLDIWVGGPGVTLASSEAN